MRVDGNKIWVRQSWLNDVMICPERARLSVVLPDWRRDSDSTIVGTSVHTGIENILNGDTQESATQAAVKEMDTLCENSKFVFTSMTSTDEMRNYVKTLVGTFVSDVLPSVKLGGRTEQTFGVKLCDTQDHEVWLGGTIDYIDPEGVIWDWKTAGRKYSQGEKQKQSIQATAYSIACTENGWSPGWPVRFNYGVVTRASRSVGQIVPILRTSNHADWFKHQVESVLTTFYGVGLDNRWMVNDQHGLCSERWCPYWSICKGSRLSGFDNTNTETTEEVING